MKLLSHNYKPRFALFDEAEYFSEGDVLILVFIFLNSFIFKLVLVVYVVHEIKLKKVNRDKQTVLFSFVIFCFQ